MTPKSESIGVRVFSWHLWEWGLLIDACVGIRLGNKPVSCWAQFRKNSGPIQRP